MTEPKCKADGDPAQRGTARALLAEINAVPNRTLGQNFLVNPGVLDHIIATACVGPDDHVLEIGPGLGALTCRLVQNAARVAAVEKDRALCDLLRRHLTRPNLHLIAGDALTVKWQELTLPETGVKVAANLPYSISKPMLRRLLEEWRSYLKSATLMVQREVAERLLARSGTTNYGPMAIMTQLYAEARLAFDVQPGSFLPPPDVVSSVVHLEILPCPRVTLADEKFFWRVVQSAFAQRRKQLANTLRTVENDRDKLAEVLQAVSIEPSRRAETLSLEEFAALAEKLRQTQPSTST